MLHTELDRKVTFLKDPLAEQVEPELQTRKAVGAELGAGCRPGVHTDLSGEVAANPVFSGQPDPEGGARRCRATTTHASVRT